jgi:proteasome activator subunit 3 (PA28 gamma)
MAHETKRRGAAAKSTPAVPSETDQQLEAFKLQCTKQGETIIKDIFPKKVLELNALLESELLSLKRMAEMANCKLNIPVPDPKLFNHEPPSKKRKSSESETVNHIDGSHVVLLPEGSVSTNERIVEVINVVKPQAIELIDHANHIKMWITYMVPKIEDGNNFGVSIQEDTMAEARQVEAEAATYLDQISRYFLTRGKIVSKVAKYPHVDDYRRTIQELDEKEFISLRLVITEMRNHYAALHDLIIKNLDKIKKPRSTNTDNMY